MADRETIDVYNARADEYRDRFDKAAPDAQLTAFIRSLPKGGMALDLGCGIGRSAALMAEAGLTVDAMDATPAFVEMARETFGVDATLGTFDTLTAESQYDGIYANFSLLHTPRHDMPDNLTRIARALKPGGLFHIGLKTGTDSRRDAIGRFYTYYTDAEITGLLNAAGLAVRVRWTGETTGLDGARAPWIVLHARKSP